jgi:hypothetical protein
MGYPGILDFTDLPLTKSDVLGERFGKAGIGRKMGREEAT